MDYLVAGAAEKQWLVIIADANRSQVLEKTGMADGLDVVGLDIHDAPARQQLVQRADIVISLMPPALHYLVAADCLAFGKNLLTASYVDDKLEAHRSEIENKGLLFLCEMGLDPGIDHMSAMRLIDSIKAGGGSITSFKSHCGGLVAPESDDNPWRYKISWNPRNVVLAGKAGAVYRLNGKQIEEAYTTLFNNERSCFINETLGTLGYYPNRDSLSYIATYGLESVHTFLRTTLRYPEFMSGWQKIVALGLTDETAVYESTGQSLSDFYNQYFLAKQLSPAADIPFLQQLEYLGINDHTTIINKGLCSAADVLQFSLERKLVLHPADRDMIVMKHEIEYSKDGKMYRADSTLVVKGTDSLRTAMAKTVGLPLGIAARLVLDGTVTQKGLHIPVSSSIYAAVLPELEKQGIVFTETLTPLS